MATLLQLRTSVAAKVGLDDTAGSTDATNVIYWLNQGVREVLLRTHCRVEIATTNLTANEWTYDLPSDVLALHRVVTSDDTPTHIVSLEEILERRRAGNTASTAELRLAVEGSNLFAVWPTPTAASTLTLFYVQRPTEMSSDSHDPSNSTYGGIPAEYHYAIELWALAQASDHEHEGRTQQGVSYLAQFDEYLKRVVRPAVNRMGGPLPRARVGRRGGYYRTDNDRYPG